MFVQKCGLLLMHRIQANLDEKAVFFFTQKVFFYPFTWVKNNWCFFIIIFLWEKITKKFQCHDILWHGGYLLSKDQENTLACFRGIANLNFFFTPFDYIQLYLYDDCNAKRKLFIRLPQPE